MFVSFEVMQFACCDLNIFIYIMFLSLYRTNNFKFYTCSSCITSCPLHYFWRADVLQCCGLNSLCHELTYVRPRLLLTDTAEAAVDRVEQLTISDSSAGRIRVKVALREIINTHFCDPYSQKLMFIIAVNSVPDALNTIVSQWSLWPRWSITECPSASCCQHIDVGVTSQLLFLPYSDLDCLIVSLFLLEL